MARDASLQTRAPRPNSRGVHEPDLSWKKQAEKTWILSRGGVGEQGVGATVLSAFLEDTYPRGISYVSYTASHRIELLSCSIQTKPTHLLAHEMQVCKSSLCVRYVHVDNLLSAITRYIYTVPDQIPIKIK